VFLSLSLPPLPPAFPRLSHFFGAFPRAGTRPFRLCVPFCEFLDRCSTVPWCRLYSSCAKSTPGCHFNSRAPWLFPFFQNH